MSRRARRMLVIAVTTIALVTGCGGARTDDTAPATAPPPSLAAPMQSPVEEPGHTDEDEELQSAEPVPTWDAGSRAAAEAAAEKVMRAFARPNVSAQDWWRTLQPLLSRSGAVAYQDTDPREVPVHRVTKPARLTATSSAYLAPVQVPTDIGTYEVLLVRDGAGAPWLAERITPPDTAPR